MNMKKMNMCGCMEKCAGFGVMFLRIIVGLTFAMHGWQKISGGVEGVFQFFNQIGIPGAGFLRHLFLGLNSSAASV